MLLDQETLRFIFGLKLRTFRQEKGLSLQQLARHTGLSASYLNEIEKGKKYPKGDKISVLAQALGVSYDELISIKLKKDLAALSQILNKNILQGLPFDLFGIPANTFLQLMAEKPQNVGALIGTILELVRNFQLNIEEFFHAAVRAYLDLNDNYLPEIENEVTRFRRAFPTLEITNPASTAIFLKSHFGVGVETTDFRQFPSELHPLYSIFREDGPALLLNAGLDDREKRFILAREIGFHVMKLRERLPTSFSPIENFEQLLNNTKAAYFASALLIPENKLVNEIGDFFQKTTWNAKDFGVWVQSYPGTVESFFHRFSQVLPKHFGIHELFYLRVRYNTLNQRFRLSRELHLSSAHGPHKARDTEHYCRRWVTTELLQQAATAQHFPLVGAQRSHFFDSTNEYLCFSVASASPVHTHRRLASTIGIHLGKQSQKVIRFLEDPSIPKNQVADTCERCGIENCTSRAAAPILFEQVQRQRRTQTALQALSTRPKNFGNGSLVPSELPPLN